MHEVKVFSAWYSKPEDLEKDVNKYMEDNPGLMIEKATMTANDSYVFLTVVFSPHAVYPIIPPISPRDNGGPYGPIGPEITKNGPSDDPWKGEFIPVGDPPLSAPIATTPTVR